MSRHYVADDDLLETYHKITRDYRWRNLVLKIGFIRLERDGKIAAAAAADLEVRRTTWGHYSALHTVLREATQRLRDINVEISRCLRITDLEKVTSLRGLTSPRGTFRLDVDIFSIDDYHRYVKECHEHFVLRMMTLEDTSSDLKRLYEARESLLLEINKIEKTLARDTFSDYNSVCNVSYSVPTIPTQGVCSEDTIKRYEDCCNSKIAEVVALFPKMKRLERYWRVVDVVCSIPKKCEICNGEHHISLNGVMYCRDDTSRPKTLQELVETMVDMRGA